MRLASDTTFRRRLLRTLLLLGGLLIIAWLAWGNRETLFTMIRQSNAGALAIAAGLGVVFTVTQGALFATLMQKNGDRTAHRLLVAAFLLSQPGKYVPGKVWAPLMQSMALGPQSRLANIGIANLELAAISILQMATLGLACLWRDTPIAITTTLLAGMLGCVVLLRFPLNALVARRLPRLARRLNVADEPGVRIGNAHALLLCAGALAVNFAASFSVLRATNIPPDTFAPVLAMLYLGFAASVLAVPVPAGMGVREIATVGLGRALTTFIPSSLLVSVALVARIWQLAVDVICFLLGALLLPRKDPSRAT